MKTTRILVSATVLALGLAPARAGENGPAYPETRRVAHVDEYHGVRVHDPYRWLEQDVRESGEVAAWVEAQNRLTFDWLEAIPARDRIRKKLENLWNFEKYGTPFKRGGRTCYFHNQGLQDHAVLTVLETREGEPRTLLDPNAWSEDGHLSLGGTSFSDDGAYVAYGVRESGSDWRTWRVMEIDTGRVLPETLRWIKFSRPSWTPDGRGFFYGRYPAPPPGKAFQESNLDRRMYYHRTGTPQRKDVLVFAIEEHPEWGFGADVTEDGRYLVISIWKPDADDVRVAYRDLAEPYACPVDLIDAFAHDFSFLGNDGPVFYFWTDQEAPRGRVVAIDVRKPDWRSPRVILPEAEATLRSVDLVGNVLIARYLENVKTRVKVFSLSGAFIREVDLPGIGSAHGFGGKRSDTETFFSFESFDTPPSIYRYDIVTGKSRLFKRAEVDVDTEGLEVKQVFYESRDGTKVPMFIAHRTGLELDGSNPALLYGYGGFKISLTPHFSATRAAWMDLGGVYAVPNLRGGGEYGEAWHKAATRCSKQNTFDDFIAAAEYLVKEGYTRPERLAIQGGSNGGLLVGAVMTQRPDLFGACLPAVGVMDMLRYHKFTAGRYWVDDYGSSDDAEECKALLAYSPYHNIKEGTAYPPTFITTADTDDRVVPMHSFKFAAAMQHAQAGAAPVLIRIETRAGHGGGKPLTQALEETADEMAFLVEVLGLTLPKGW